MKHLRYDCLLFLAQRDAGSSRWVGITFMVSKQDCITILSIYCLICFPVSGLSLLLSNSKDVDV